MHRRHAILSLAPPLCKLRQSRTQFREFERQKVAVANVHEIAQDSPVLVYTDMEGISGWWNWEFMSLTPQSAFGMCLRTQRNVKKNTAVIWCCRAREKTFHRIRLKKILGHSSMKKKKCNDLLEPHFQTSATKSRCPKDTKLLSFCHTVVRAP